ncbi:MAG: transglutaminase-like domain-containing protein [Desulfobacterales bacterium]|jgi:transglutaminase-like putative cysteine protease|nr:transglutaminase-like domain-containing protein [Desulfobacteraceae bacterium]MDY0311480.1 transglutaminase-like domain-containing protein [Desulfobacterales bacterium]
MDEYLKATAAIEAEHPLIKAKAAELTAGVATDREKAVRLFYFVRDQIPYNLFMISMHPDDFRASFILETGKGYCVQKAVLLCALARAAGIPSRLALARIRNHRVPSKIRERLGRNEFPGHGYNQFLLEGQWVTAAATFDAKLCSRVGVPVVEFDGRNDAMLPDKALDGSPYIEYVERYGTFDDLPLDFITERTSKIWGKDKRCWLRPEDDTGFP